MERNLVTGVACGIAAVTWCARRLHHGAQPAGHMPAD